MLSAESANVGKVGKVGEIGRINPVRAGSSRSKKSFFCGVPSIQLVKTEKKINSILLKCEDGARAALNPSGFSCLPAAESVFERITRLLSWCLAFR